MSCRPGSEAYGCRGQFCPFKHPNSLLSSHRTVTHTQKYQASLLAAVISVQGYCGSYPNQGEIVWPASQLNEGTPCTSRKCREFGFDQQLIRLEDGGKQTDEEFIRRHPVLPSLAAQQEACFKGYTHRG